MEDLEKGILEWIAIHSDSAELSSQIASATVQRRDFMGTGLFLYLNVPADQPDVPANVRPVCPHIESEMLMDGAGCNLFMKNGQLHYLEVYSRGGFMPERLQDWRLGPNSP